MKRIELDLESSKAWFDFLNKTYEYRIPIKVFNESEYLVRPYMRSKGYRAMYRGPRIHNNTKNKPSMTRRCDATTVIIGWYYN